MARRRKIARLFVLILLAANTLTWSAIWRLERRRLTVAFLDVGQGDAIFIEAPNGNQVLLDGGPGAQVLGRLSQVMPFYDRTIDLVIASHPDADHIGGLPEVFRRYEVLGFMEPGVRSTTATYQELRRAVTAEAVPTVLARRGMRVMLDESSGVYLNVLFPDTNVTDWRDTNESSIVAKLIDGQTSFLLTGDSPIKIEKYLLGLSPPAPGPWSLATSVLKAGHHGSRTSSDSAYVAAVAPDYVVLSVGRRNRYGHPHPEVLSFFQKLGPRIFRTDKQGTIIFQGDGRQLTLDNSGVTL